MRYVCDPEKISIYINSRRKTAAEIKAETGCTAIINGGLYNMTSFLPVCHLKADGTVLAADKWKYQGLAWNKNDLTMTEDYSGWRNYICCVALVQNGRAVRLIYDAGTGGARARTAMGVFPDGSVWLYADQTPRTPEQLQRVAVETGVKHAIMLDGGGSTQCIFPDGELHSSRRVQNYICVWASDSKKQKQDNSAPKKKILLISGHGAGDCGAVSTIDGKKYTEAEETVKLAELLAPMISEFAEVTMYPAERDAYQDYKKGLLVPIAGFENYDYVLEIHFNACVSDLKGNGKTTGTECYVPTSKSQFTVENAICDSVAALGLKNRGVKRRDFAVIYQASCKGAASALLETCFLDDADDMRIYLASRENMAKAIAKGLKKGLGI